MRAMRRAISPRLAISRDVMGVTAVVVLEQAACVAMDAAMGAKKRGVEDAGPSEGIRRRCEVRLRDRILELRLRMRKFWPGSCSSDSNG